MSGFKTISKEDQKAYSRLGAEKLHAEGKAYKFTSEKAREAGRMGGIASGEARRAKKARKDEVRLEEGSEA